MEYYAAERKKELLPFMTAWMELESIKVNEISQAVKDKPYDLTYKWKLINKTSKQNITRNTEIKNKLTVTRGEGQGDNRGKKGKGHKGTGIKDPWTKPKGVRIRVGDGAGESGGGKMETTILEQ